MTLEPENLFIVADGMGGQQAGEKASLMAVELIPRAIARRLTAEEKEPRQIQDSIREAVAEVNSEILEARPGHRILEHGHDRRPGPVSPGPRFRRGHR